MRFKDFYENKRKNSTKLFIELLNEARPFEPKYTNGWQFFLKDNSIKTFNNKAKLDPNFIKDVDGSFMTKVEPTDKAIKVEFGGNQEKEVYLKHNDTLQTFHVIGASMSTHFNRVVNKTGFNWQNINVLETAQCLGFFVDGYKMLNAIINKEPLKKYITKIVNTLNKKYDWEQTSKTYIIEHLEKPSIADITQLAMLIAGSTSFMSNKIKKIMPSNSYYIIHGKIGEYYSAEELNPEIKKSGTKANTADTIVSTVTADKLIKLVQKERVTYDNNGVCSLSNNKDAKFIQVSLKKARGGAQLGKITSLIQQKYDIPRYIDLLNVALEEGFKEVFSNTFNKVKEIGQGLYAVLVKLGKKLTEFGKSTLSLLNSNWKKQWKKDLKEMEKILGVADGTLQEALALDKNGMLIEKKVSLNQKLIEISSKKTQVNKIIKAVNNRLNDFSKAAKSSKVVVFKAPDRVKLAKGPFNVESVIKLFSNYTGIYMLQKIGITNAKSAASSFKEIFELQKEMLFGKTSLPLYKVYGAKSVDDVNTYEFLKTGAEFLDKKLKEVSSFKKVTMGCRANIHNSNQYYVLLSHLLYGIDDQGEPQYSTMRLGTNQGGTNFAFVFEGTQIISHKQLQKAYQ